MCILARSPVFIPRTETALDMMNILYLVLLSCTNPRNKRDRLCPKPTLMIQTQQQAIKPNKTSTRQNLKRVRHLWLQTKNQISTLRINPDSHFDIPLVEPNSPLPRHCFSQTQKSCFIPPIRTIIFNCQWCQLKVFPQGNVDFSIDSRIEWYFASSGLMVVFLEIG
jgi:hypothetical protein